MQKTISSGCGLAVKIKSWMLCDVRLIVCNRPIPANVTRPRMSVSCNGRKTRSTGTVHGSFFVLLLASLALWYKRESSNAANSIEKSIHYSHSKLRNLSNNLNPSYTTPPLFWLSVQIPSELEYWS